MADNSFQHDTHLLGLVEAATAAAADHETQLSQALRDHLDVPEEQQGQVVAGDSGYPPINDEGQEPTRKKRRTAGETTSPEGVPADVVNTPRPALPQSPAVIHSASALFREPSSSSKKWTRPPMSKLYTSLELSTENFLYLQAEAKAYMLDPAHPERQDTVGERGKGDGDLVKLRLWNTCKDFLSDLGNGEKYFGESVTNPEGDIRTMVWPRDSAGIIKQVIPLMRRMVTNERQRQYAIESRKPGAKSPNKSEPKLSKYSRIGLTHLSEKEIGTLAVPDLLGDNCIPASIDSAMWFKDYNKDNALEDFYQRSALAEANFRILVANIDGHCRFFHQEDPAPCFDECQSAAIERLLTWDKLGTSTASFTIDPRIWLSDLFLHVRNSLALHEVWPNVQPDVPQTGYAEASAEDHPTSIEAHQPAMASMEGTKGPLTLVINLVSSDPPLSATSYSNTLKRTHPPFTLARDDAPDLKALRSRLKKHYAGEASIKAPREFEIKVWLPDGLVPVRNDGEWAVALLSAEMVGWMDGELRVLVEI